MKKSIAKIPFAFQFDPAHKGAHYTIDGVHYLNNGEFAEAVDKAIKGYCAIKDPCTAYDKGSDIAETHTSVKSGKATLTSKFLGNTMDEVMENYFNTCPSTNWDWVVVIDDEATIYNMNEVEFFEFTKMWATYDNSRKVVRYKPTSGIMIKWLEARL